ncbi:MAG: hypothetical protein A3F43_02995 [Gammaproteobacteria bacterium RIFCSPHIGHO2_12_FULL_42_10]|nr:MAG: hypothetical protein A3F43_02995 [Gammaproteobacteria bacterium RIFCSPHIGHO2_12_FULL_42_10]
MAKKNNIVNTINVLQFYTKSLLIAAPLAIALLIYLLSIGAADLVFSDWFLMLASVPGFLAYQLSAAANFGRLVDLFKAFKKTLRENRHELIGTAIGVALGIAIGIGLAVMRIPVPLASSLYAFAGVLFTLRQISVFGGLGNRIGKCTDKNSRPLSEKVLVVSSTLMGLALGIALFSTFTASMVSVVGVTVFFSGGAAIPLWIAGAIFVLSVSSGCASSADYIAKSISFIRAQFIKSSNKESMIKKTVELKPFEYGGALVGVSTGAIIGIIILGAIAVTNPVILGGLVGAVTAFLVLITCMSIVGSISSRTGRSVDEWRTARKNIPTDPATADNTIRIQPEAEIRLGSNTGPSLTLRHTQSSTAAATPQPRPTNDSVRKRAASCPAKLWYTRNPAHFHTTSETFVRSASCTAKI